MWTINPFGKASKAHPPSSAGNGRRFAVLAMRPLRLEALEARRLLNAGDALTYTSRAADFIAAPQCNDTLSRYVDGPDCLKRQVIARKAIDSTAIWQDTQFLSSIVRNQVLVGFETQDRISEIGACVGTFNWPGAIGSVTPDNVERVYSIPKRAGGFLTVAKIHLRTEIDALDAVAELESSDFVEFAAPDFFFQNGAEEFVPNDPLIGDPGQSFHENMQNYAAWDTTRGGSEDAFIAVVDSGFDLDHQDLINNIWTEEVGTLLETDHGTHVAGIVAAEVNNAIGVAGVAGEATILPMRGDWFSYRCTAFETATDISIRDNKHLIVNCSQRIDDSWLEWPAYREIYCGALDYMYNNGVLHINSAGNDNECDPFRQVLTQTLYVGATDDWDIKATDSNYGTGIDVSAPGVDILSTVSDNGYGELSGTSMAAPCVSGTAALIWSENPSWSRDRVAAQLLATADNIDQQNPDKVGLLGSGRVNSNRAVNEIINDPDNYPETFAPPRIDGIREVPVLVTSGMTELTIELASVFQGPTFDQWGALVESSPLDDPANWELRSAGSDGKFDTGDDEAIDLTLDFLTSPYSDIGGYKVGMNDLQFSFDPLADGRYRFTAFADELVDPFGTPLDGNGNGEAGDDYVRYFYVGTPYYDLDVTADSTSGITGNGSGNGTPDTFVLQLDQTAQGYAEVWINDVLYDKRLTMEYDNVSISGSTDDDEVTVQLGGDFHGPTAFRNGEVGIDSGGGGNDTLLLYGSPGHDLFTAGPGEVYLYVDPDDDDTPEEFQYVVCSETLEEATAINKAKAFGGGGNDTAGLTDTDGDDVFENDATRAWMNTPESAVYFEAEDFAWVEGKAELGGNDQALLHGFADGDTFQGYFARGSTLRTENLTVSAGDFEELEADTGGEFGAAHLYFDVPDTELEANWHWAEHKLPAASRWNRVVGFETVYAHANPAQFDPLLGDQMEMNLVLVDSGFEALFWDERGDGGWLDANRWLDRDLIPRPWCPDNENYHAGVETDKVTIPLGESIQLHHLSVVGGTVIHEGGDPQQGAELLLDDLSVANATVVNPLDFSDANALQNLTVGIGGATVEADLKVTDTLLAAHGTATLTVQGAVELDGEATYVSQIGSSSDLFRPEEGRPYYLTFHNGQIVADGDVASIDGTLQLPSRGKLAPPFPLDPDDPESPLVQWWGDQARTIVGGEEGGTVSGSFNAVPQAQPEEWQLPQGQPGDPDYDPGNWGQGHLGYGVYLTRLGDWGANLPDPPDPPQPGLSYTTDATQAHLFQPCDGDVNGDRYLESHDIQYILGFGEYLTGVPCTWPEGDFNGHQDPDDPDLSYRVRNSIGYCDSYDIQLILSTGLWPPADPPECYCDPPEGGGGGQAAAGAEGGGSLDAGDSVAELIVTPRGLYVETNGLGLNSFIISSQSSVFTGHSAIQPSVALDGSGELLERFRVDANDEISSAFFRLDGEHFLGDVVGQQPRGVDLPSDLTMTYTVDGRPGIFEGRVMVNLGVDEALAEAAGPAGAPAADSPDPAADLVGWLYQFEPTTPDQHSSKPSDPAKAAVDLLLTAAAV